MAVQADFNNQPNISIASSQATADATDPHGEYQRRLNERENIAERFSRIESFVSASRGIAFLAGILLLIIASNVGGFSLWWLGFPVFIFVGLILFHSRVIRSLSQARSVIQHYKQAIDRINGRWSGVGPNGGRYDDPAHRYASDLDIFGHGSLFQLLSTARTRLGEDRLAAWLTNPADIQTIIARQQAVEELRRRLDLRENLALLDARVHDDFDQNQLLEWSQEPQQFISPARRILAIVLAGAAVVTFFGWLFFDWRLAPLAVVLTVEVLFAFSFRDHLLHVARTLDKAGCGLAILSQVLNLIEREQFKTKKLQQIRSALDADGLPPSRRIAQLNNLIQSLNNSLKNQFFAPLAIVLGLPVHLLHSIETWKATVGPHIPDWLTSVGEFEALCAFSGFAYEHSGYPFPEIVEAGPHFEAKALGHPLLSDDGCVQNDVALNNELRLIMISGSNMSGKSTLLRTIGTNIVLALAGAPVRAESLRVSPVMIGTSMRIRDSLQEGASLFYTAISRLKSIVDLAEGEPSLLFLFDEILQGTNSHDRRVGAEAIITQIIARGAIGLVTTHDLALTRIVESLGKQATNVHFEDRLADGRMTFDYRLRQGVVQKSNALEMMRMVGLDVDDDSSA